MLKPIFNFLDAIMKCQKCSESEALHEIGEVHRYEKDRMVGSTYQVSFFNFI